MVKVFIGKLLDKTPYLPVLFPNFGLINDERHIFTNKAYCSFTTKVFDIVEDVKNSDFILLPYDFFYIFDKERRIVDEYISLSKKFSKKLLIFDFSDYTERRIDIENAWIFRVAGYKHHPRKNEIIMPCFVEDLSFSEKIEFREKGNIPVIGFCGWADFKNFQIQSRAYLRMAYFKIIRFFSGDRDLKSHEQGLIFRRKIIRELAESEKVKTNFIIRKAYGSHKNTIELNPEKSREQYIGNIINSDFTLAIRGDANFSQRFYEILSLGRIPVLFDTDCILPLEGDLRYEEFILRIDYRDIDRMADIISEFYRKLTPDDFKKMQQMARDVFVRYLKAESFFQYILPTLIQK